MTDVSLRHIGLTPGSCRLCDVEEEAGSRLKAGMMTETKIA
jgi:hypothetical protein